MGQYYDYETVLLVANEDRILFLAIPDSVYPKFQSSRVISGSIERAGMRLILVDIFKQEIVQWIS